MELALADINDLIRREEMKHRIVEDFVFLAIVVELFVLSFYKTFSTLR